MEQTNRYQDPEQNMTGNSRMPLGSLPTNSPSKKRQKLTVATSVSIVNPPLSRSATLTPAANPLLCVNQQQLPRQQRQYQCHQAQLDQQAELQHIQEQQQLAAQARLQENKEHLNNWRILWRKSITESRIYFQKELETPQETIKRRKLLKMFLKAGATVCNFFSRDVTIVITNTPKENLPSNILGLNESVKIWNHTKATRFLKNLGVYTNSNEFEDSSLQQLFQREKIHGSTDSDPNAKKDNFQFFKDPHFCIYDARQVVKPIAFREWITTKDDPKPWPHFQKSSCGYSLFQDDPKGTHSDHKRDRRKLRFQMNKEYRDQLRDIYDRRSSSRSSSSQPPSSSPKISREPSSDVNMNDLEGEEERYNEDEDQRQDKQQQHKQHQQTQAEPTNEPCFQLPALPSHLHNQLTLPRQETNIESNQQGGDGSLQASGYHASNAVTQQPGDFQSKNGLAPSMTSNPSKAVHSLQRQVLEDITKKKQSKKSSSTKNNVKADKKVSVPGYCENCKVSFNDFDDHIISPGHRDFAMTDSNFTQIDELIHNLHQCIKTKS